MSEPQSPDTQPQNLDTRPQGLESDGGNPPATELPAITAIARQAIVDDKGAVFGYELFDRSRNTQDHDAASDAQLLFNVLSHADTSALIDSRTMFVNCTHAGLAGGHLELVQPDRIVLEIPPVPGNSVDEIDSRIRALTDIRKRGFRLAFNQTVLTSAYQQWLPLASFIKIDLLTLKPELIAATIGVAQKRSQAQIIVEKIETAEQHALVQSLGVTLFQGYWFAKPAVVHGQTLRPAQAAIIQLINLVRKQAATAEIEEVLKHDASLSFNLLRFINSSGFGLRTEITSFRQAVMLLGLKKLFRWAALLLTTSRSGGVPPVVGQTAIVRGRLMELLAAELLPPEECDNAFVTGVFSLLDTMLGMPLEKALDALALPEPVVAALLHNEGPLAPFLALTIACETADDEVFARTANQLGLDNRQVNWAHLQALAWAETMGT
jgi:EAL and modified HD-GYP domain-containing signal transduction protein